MEVSSLGFVVQNPLTSFFLEPGKGSHWQQEVHGFWMILLLDSWSLLIVFGLHSNAEITYPLHHTGFCPSRRPLMKIISTPQAMSRYQFDFHNSSYHFVHMFFQFKSSMFGPRSWYNQVQISPFVPSSSWVRRCPFIHRRVFLVENWKLFCGGCQGFWCIPRNI